MKRALKHSNKRRYLGIMLAGILLFFGLVSPRLPAMATCSGPSGTVGTIIYNSSSRVPQYCDNTNWIAMAPPNGFTPKAVNFNGTTTSGDFLKHVGPVTTSDSPYVTFSAWWKATANGNGQELFGAEYFAMALKPDPALDIIAADAGGTQRCWIGGYNAYGGTWHHILVSMHATNSSKTKVYVDDQAQACFFVTNTATNFKFSGQSSLFVGSGQGADGANPWKNLQGDLAEVWIDYGTYIDITQESNRRKFIQKNGKPAFLGRSGQLPTGSKPEVYLSGDINEFPLNKGTGGDFTPMGSVTDATSSPEGFIASARINAYGLDMNLNAKWAKGTVGPDGKIYGTPRNKNYFLIIDPTTDTAIESTLGATIPVTGNKWVGGTLGKDGKIYMPPQNQTSILIVDPLNSSATTATLGATFSGSDQFSDSVLGKDGKIYAVPTGSASPPDILIIDTDSQTATRTTMGATLTGGGWGDPILGPDGKIYAIGTTDILVIDTDTQTATRTTMGASFANPGWKGSALGADGKIYSAPDDATDVLIIDTATQTITRNNFGLTFSGSNEFSGLVAGADGLLYGIPRSSSNILIIDPVAGTAKRSTLGVTLSGSTMYSGGVLGPDGKIYGIPWNNTSPGVLIIESLRVCRNPLGTMGEIYYDTNTHAMMYCDGENWIAMAPSSEPVKGLVVRYKLDESSGTTAYDTTGLYPATLQNGPVWAPTQGKINGALKFDGSDDKTDGGSIPGLNNLSEFTFTAWVKPTAPGELSIGGIITKGGTNGASVSKRFVMNSSTSCSDGSTDYCLELSVNRATTDAKVFSHADTLTAGTWQFVAGTYTSADGPRLYKNGAELTYLSRVIGSGSESADTTSNLTLGGWPTNTTNGSYPGYIDDARVYNRALSASEIADLYNITKSDYQNHLVAYWPFDGSDATITPELVSGLDGVGKNGVVFSSSGGKIGGYATFDGSDDYVQETMDFPETRGSVSVWLKPSLSFSEGIAYYACDSTCEGLSAHDGFCAGSADFEFNIGQDSGTTGQWNVTYQDGTNASCTKVNGPDGGVQAGVWQHIVGTWDATGYLRLYKNGSEIANADLTVKTFSGLKAPQSYIGRTGRTTGAKRWWQGGIDDLRIYDRQLTATEVNDIYQAGVAGHTSKNCTSPDGAEGTMVYNTTVDAMQYCDGSKWIKLGKR